MGYEISLQNCEFTIKEKNLSKAFDAAHEILSDAHKNEMHGGSWQNRKRLEWCYSWVDMEKAKACKSLEGILEEFGWDAIHDTEGNICGLEFEDRKIGQEEVLFRAIAPYVEPGSFIEILGEDGTRWRWVFDGSVLKELQATIVWKEA
ncbi:MAG: hypothetical protein WC505_07710 [Patescibacteria group bacterium]